MEFFATTGKGIEDLLADELRALGLEVVAVEGGGVRFAGDISDCWRANLWLRTANRVLMPLAVFTVRHAPGTLRRGALDSLVHAISPLP